MPTGYTSDLYEGKDQSFSEFVWNCSRAFGVHVTLRDSPDAELPESYEPDTHHQKRLMQAEAERGRWQLMSDDEVAADLRREQAEAETYKRQIIDVAEERESRYNAMLFEVEAWDPPTEEHQGLKDFMIQQLTESIRFDCSTTYIPNTPPDDVDAWRQNRIDYAQRQIDYHTEQWDKECERTKTRNAWIKALRDSLDGSAD